MRQAARLAMSLRSAAEAGVIAPYLDGVPPMGCSLEVVGSYETAARSPHGLDCQATGRRAPASHRRPPYPYRPSYRVARTKSSNHRWDNSFYRCSRRRFAAWHAGPGPERIRPGRYDLRLGACRPSGRPFRNASESLKRHPWPDLTDHESVVSLLIVWSSWGDRGRRHASDETTALVQNTSDNVIAVVLHKTLYQALQHEGWVRARAEASARRQISRCTPWNPWNIENHDTCNASR